MKPAWARKFEPPAVCSAVTARNIRTLVDIYLYTKDEKYLEPIPAAIEWLDTFTIGENLWARMYEVGTNRPIYGDVDGKIHYTLEEISEERKSGYSWQSGYGIESAIAYYMKARDGTLLPVSSQPLRPEQRLKRRQELAVSVSRIISELDDRGRWVNREDNRIYTSDFVGNFDRLCEYLELSREE